MLQISHYNKLPIAVFLFFLTQIPSWIAKAAKSLPEKNSIQQRESLYVKKSNNETLFTPLRHVRDIPYASHCNK